MCISLFQPCIDHKYLRQTLLIVIFLVTDLSTSGFGLQHVHGWKPTSFIMISYHFKENVEKIELLRFNIINRFWYRSMFFEHIRFFWGNEVCFWNCFELTFWNVLFNSIVSVETNTLIIVYRHITLQLSCSIFKNIFERFDVKCLHCNNSHPSIFVHHSNKSINLQS